MRLHKINPNVKNALQRRLMLERQGISRRDIVDEIVVQLLLPTHGHHSENWIRQLLKEFDSNTHKLIFYLGHWGPFPGMYRDACDRSDCCLCAVKIDGGVCIGFSVRDPVDNVLYPSDLARRVACRLAYIKAYMSPMSRSNTLKIDVFPVHVAEQIIRYFKCSELQVNISVVETRGMRRTRRVTTSYIELEDFETRFAEPETVSTMSTEVDPAIRQILETGELKGVRE